jgi:hypothetical protein
VIDSLSSLCFPWLALVQWASAEEDRVYPRDGRTADRRVAGAGSQALTPTAV